MLDKNKPYREFKGANPIGAKYQQGPKAYNHNGEEVCWETGEVIEPKVPEPKVPEPKAKPARSKASK